MDLEKSRYVIYVCELWSTSSDLVWSTMNTQNSTLGHQDGTSVKRYNTIYSFVGIGSQTVLRVLSV